LAYEYPTSENARPPAALLDTARWPIRSWRSAKKRKCGNCQARSRIIEELRGPDSEEKLALKAHDTIQTNDFPINGRLEMTTLKAHNPLFGDVYR